MAALSKRKELKGLFTFFAANYPQYEIIIDNDVTMQKGVTIRDAMENLSIVIEVPGNKVRSLRTVLQSLCPGSSGIPTVPEDLDNMFVKNDQGEMVPYSAFMRLEKKQGLNEITRYNLYPTAPIQGAPPAVTAAVKRLLRSRKWLLKRFQML